jgi:DNA polymerase-3 subunit gamma/tau
LRAGGARQQPARSVARATGRPTGRDDSVPLPPEPLDDETPPDDEEAMLAEFDAGPSEHAGPDPAEAAIALLTSQLGARAIDRR